MTTVQSPLACCDHLPEGSLLNRRRFLQLAALSGGAVLLKQVHAEPEHGAASAAHTTEALLLSCMDYRLMDDIAKYMDARGLTDQYDHVVLAGAALGAVTKNFKDWNKTFWEHLKISIDLHQINSVILMDHRDCGAYKVILKADFSKDPLLEERVHSKYLRELAQAIGKRYPKLEIEMLLMNLDGTVQTIA